MRNAAYRELTSAPPRYDAKPARFALNQGSRKRSSGGVTCPGFIRCTGLAGTDTPQAELVQKTAKFNCDCHKVKDMLSKISCVI